MNRFFCWLNGCRLTHWEYGQMDCDRCGEYCEDSSFYRSPVWWPLHYRLLEMRHALRFWWHHECRNFDCQRSLRLTADDFCSENCEAKHVPF